MRKQLPLTEKEQLIYNYKLKHPEATLAEIAEVFGRSKRTIDSSLCRIGLKLHNNHGAGRLPLSEREKEALKLIVHDGVKASKTLARLMGVGVYRAKRIIWSIRRKGWKLPSLRLIL